jgi:glyoxylase-like metal-dependent hydrolase (beta-lactamase superfamily II)
VIFRQLLHFHPVGASYLLGCGGQGVCAVVDPVAPIETYVELARSMAMQIRHVIDTHVHADHLSGLLLSLTLVQDTTRFVHAEPPAQRLSHR